MRTQIWRLLTLFVLAAALWAQDSSPQAPPEIEEALRSRVSAYYELYQQGKLRQTEEFIAEEWRDAYYGISKNTIQNYEISELRFAPDFQSAEVVVLCESIVAVQSQGTLMKLPIRSRWKLVDGQWYALMGAPSGATITTPFGSLKSRPAGSEAAAVPGTVEPAGFVKPTPQSLATMYRLIGQPNLKYSTAGESPVTHAIAMENTGGPLLSLRREFPEMEGIEVTTDVEHIAKGERMIVSITYHPEDALVVGRKKLDFTILPLNQTFSLTLDFE